MNDVFRNNVTAIFNAVKDMEGGREFLHAVKDAFLLASGHDDSFIPQFKSLLNFCNEDELSNKINLSALLDGTAIFGKIRNNDNWTYMAFYKNTENLVFVDIDHQDKYYITKLKSFDHDVIKLPSLYDNFGFTDEMYEIYGGDTFNPRVGMSLTDMKNKLRYILAHSFVIKHTEDVNNIFDCCDVTVYTNEDIDEYFDKSNDGIHKFAFINS